MKKSLREQLMQVYNTYITELAWLNNRREELRGHEERVRARFQKTIVDMGGQYLSDCDENQI